MTAVLEGGEWSAELPGRTLHLGKTWYPFYRRLGGPQGRSGRTENLVPTGIVSRTVQPVAHSLYRLSYPVLSFLLYIINYSSRTTPIVCHISHSLLTYLLTAWCRVLLEKLTGLQVVKKFPAFHWTRRFITALTSVLHLALSWASPIQSIYPHPTSWSSVLILSTHLRLGLQWSPFLRFPHQDPVHPTISLVTKLNFYPLGSVNL